MLLYRVSFFNDTAEIMYSSLKWETDFPRPAFVKFGNFNSQNSVILLSHFNSKGHVTIQ